MLPLARPLLGAAQLGAHQSSSTFGDRARLDGARGLRQERLGRRLRRPLVVGPGWAKKASPSRGEGDPRRRAEHGESTWMHRRASSRSPRRSRARVARAGGGEWHIRATLAALARRARGRGERPAAAAGPDPGASAGSRSARATTCSAACALRVRRGRRAVVRRRGPARRWRTALRRVAHDQQRDVVLAAARRARARAARGRRPRPAGAARRSARARSRSSPTSIGARAVLDPGETAVSAPGSDSRRGARGLQQLRIVPKRSVPHRYLRAPGR